MKLKLSVISIILILTTLTSCSAITGKASLSGVKIKKSKIESIGIGGRTGVEHFFNEEETDKFIELFNSVSTGIIPEGEIVTPDTIVTVYYKNGRKNCFYFYGEDYSTLELRAYDKDGERDEWYYFKSDDLRKFVYDTAKKYFESEQS